MVAAGKLSSQMTILLMKNDLEILPGVRAYIILIRTIMLFAPARARTMFGQRGLGRSSLAILSRSLLAGQAVPSTSPSRASDIRRVPLSPLTTTLWFSHGMILANQRCRTSSPMAIWVFPVCSNSALALSLLRWVSARSFFQPATPSYPHESIQSAWV